MSRTCHSLNHALVKYVSEESLSTLKDPLSLISDPSGDYNYVIVSPCWDKYQTDYYWGDYIDYSDATRIGSVGVTNQQLLSNLDFLLTHQSDECRFNVHVFFITAQRHNLKLQNPNFTFIELPEYYGEYWQIFQTIHSNDSQIGLHWNSKKKHFCNFNKRPDLFRQKWFYEVLENNALKEASNFSYICEDPTTRKICKSSFKRLHEDSGNTNDPALYIEMLPYSTDNNRTSIKIKPAKQYGWHVPVDVIEESLIWIVNETFFDHPWDPVLTEKIFKPLYFQMPFLLFGSPGMLKELKRLGFKTFSGLINESYDYEFNNQIRFNMIVNEAKRLANIPLPELVSAVKALEPILVHNHNRMKELHQELMLEISRIDNFIDAHINNQTLLGY